MVKAAKGKFNEIVYSDCRRPTIVLGVTALRRVGDVSFLLIIPSANVLRISFYMACAPRRSSILFATQPTDQVRNSCRLKSVSLFSIRTPHCGRAPNVHVHDLLCRTAAHTCEDQGQHSRRGRHPLSPAADPRQRDGVRARRSSFFFFSGSRHAIGRQHWHLKKNFIPGFVTSRCRFVEQRRPVSALVAIRSPSATELPALLDHSLDGACSLGPCSGM